MNRGTRVIELPAGVRRVRLDRRDVSEIRDACAGIDVVVHTCAYDRADAEAIVSALPSGCRLIVLSSQDVYRAFGTALHGGPPIDAVPIDERAPLRTTRFPYRGHTELREVDPETYEKIDVEEVCLAHGGVIVRLPMVYGEHDPKRREDFVLKRIRAGRTRIPIGDGSWLWSRVWVGDVALAVRAMIEREVVREVLNVAEHSTWCISDWMRRIAEAAGATIEFVRVPDKSLPEDLELSVANAQHLLVDSSRARRLLDWDSRDAGESLLRSVKWHLANPPEETSPVNFEADDRALANA